MEKVTHLSTAWSFSQLILTQVEKKNNLWQIGNFLTIKCEEVLTLILKRYSLKQAKWLFLKIWVPLSGTLSSSRFQSPSNNFFPFGGHKKSSSSFQDERTKSSGGENHPSKTLDQIIHESASTANISTKQKPLLFCTRRTCSFSTSTENAENSSSSLHGTGFTQDFAIHFLNRAQSGLL